LISSSVAPGSVKAAAYTYGRHQKKKNQYKEVKEKPEFVRQVEKKMNINGIQINTQGREEHPSARNGSKNAFLHKAKRMNTK